MTSGQTIATNRSPAPARRISLAVLIMLGALPSRAHASLMSPEFEDKLATFIALFVIFVVPVVLITVFWLVHILPEKIAHKRHHPQFEAIRTLCLLSLAFGGLLWPIAWIWAYSKPVMYKMAYGTDVHPDALKEHQEVPALEATAGGAALSDRLARLEQRGLPAAELKALRADLDAIEAKYTVDEAR